MNKFLLFLLCSFSCALLTAQISFTDNSSLLPVPSNNGVSLTVTDMNGDHMDDIVHFNQSQVLMIEYQQIDGTFQNYTFGSVSNNNQWSAIAADVDENGYLDVFCGGSYDGAHLVTANADGTDYEMSDLPGSNYFMQGSCFADFDNDGAIDIFSCHDDGESKIWLNDGTGSFDQSDIIDFDISNSDDSGNYGCIWTDFDMDGDLDLFIAKCRQGVNNPSDPRRINVLFENDGNYNFTENAAAHGLDNGNQSWTADFGDYDNDGDFDIFITNHNTDNQLFRNDNGVYTDVSAASGINGSSFPIQAVFVDFDNDGWLDILIAGASHELYQNNQDGTFSIMANPFDNDDMESFALGDLNSDGFIDIYGGYGNIYTDPSNIEDKLWLNDGNDNNYISVSLEGTITNRDGIGARITAYGEWGQMVREVRAGVSYGIMNTMTQTFGLGQSTAIDSITVNWPSGISDIIYNPEINECITIIENLCTAPNPAVQVDGPLVFCSGGEVTLTALNGNGWEWSNGDTTQSITVDESGVYSVTVFDGALCSSSSADFEVIVDPVEVPIITISGNLEICETESVTLTASESDNYLWSNNADTQSITISEAGDYYVETEGLCENWTSETVTISVTDVAEPTTTGDTVEGGMGTANLTATGDEPIWYDQEVGGNVVNLGNSYDPFLTETTSFWVADQLASGVDTAFAALPDSSGFGGGENSPNFNGHLVFDAFQEIEILSVLVYAYIPGERTFEVRDSDGNTVTSTTVDVPVGEHRVELNFVVPQGDDYELACPNDPSLHRSAENIAFPYDLNGAGEIHNSSFGTTWYYYFYDWEIRTQNGVCESERVEVIGTVIPNSVEELSASFEVFPNPAEDELWIIQNGIQAYNLELNDLLGKTHIQKLAINGQREKIDISSLSPGVYLLTVRMNGEQFSKKIVKK
ncbi:MAG: FG-GAP-like repeat-containing protein [Bacteroidota bacterium]